MSNPENPTPVPRSPAKVAMRVRDIQAILQSKGRFELVQQTEPPIDLAQSAIYPKIAANTRHHRSDPTLLVEVDYTFQAASIPLNAPDPDAAFVTAPRVFDIEASFAVVYELDSFNGLEAADFDVFARVNGLLNTMPYWREFVHTACSRAGLPPFPIPPFNPAKQFAEAKAKAT
jgi:hypothetical protein